MSPSWASWLRAHYPTDAADCRPGLAAIRHSLRKWRGALRVNLRKHRVKLLRDVAYGVHDSEWEGELREGVLVFNVDSCALCAHYYESGPARCPRCPIVLSGQLACDAPGSAYSTYESRLMVRALERAERWWLRYRGRRA